MLASGTGSILEAIVAADLPVRLVVVDRPCPAVEVAEAASVPAVVVDRSAFGGFGAAFDREAYTVALTDVLLESGIDVVVMAGFGTVLAQAVHDAYPGRILNTHPALLPAFPGMHGVRDALAYGVKVTGCTVFLVDEGVDAGPVLAQAAVPVLDDDDGPSLHERIKVAERALLVDTVGRMARDGWSVHGDRKVRIGK